MIRDIGVAGYQGEIFSVNRPSSDRDAIVIRGLRISLANSFPWWPLRNWWPPLMTGAANTNCTVLFQLPDLNSLDEKVSVYPESSHVRKS